MESHCREASVQISYSPFIWYLRNCSGRVGRLRGTEGRRVWCEEPAWFSVGEAGFWGNVRRWSWVLSNSGEAVKKTKDRMDVKGKGIREGVVMFAWKKGRDMGYGSRGGWSSEAQVHRFCTLNAFHPRPLFDCMGCLWGRCYCPSSHVGKLGHRRGYKLLVFTQLGCFRARILTQSLKALQHSPWFKSMVLLIHNTKVLERLPFCNLITSLKDALLLYLFIPQDVLTQCSVPLCPGALTWYLFPLMQVLAHVAPHLDSRERSHLAVGNSSLREPEWLPEREGRRNISCFRSGAGRVEWGGPACVVLWLAVSCSCSLPTLLLPAWGRSHGQPAGTCSTWQGEALHEVRAAREGSASLAPGPQAAGSCGLPTATGVHLSELPRKGRIGREQLMSLLILIL